MGTTIAAAAFRAAAESGDEAAMAALIADDISFSSPAVHEPYQGRDTVLPILLAARRVLGAEFHYVDEAGGDDGRHVLFFRTRVGDRDVEGIDALRFDADGKVSELVVMIRPLSGLQAVVRGVGRELGLTSD